MSLHRSLKTKPSALNQHRNVLTRAERVSILMQEDRFNPDEQSPIGLVKVANRQIITKKKKAAKEEAGEEGEVKKEGAASKA